MHLTLVVSHGSQKGTEIPVAGPHFLIGRDPQCDLRPASPMISRRHCALVIREGKVFVRDFGSTNGTIVNDRRIYGEAVLASGDRLEVPPLVFDVRIESGVPVDRRTPLPPNRTEGPVGDADALCALLDDLERPGAGFPAGRRPGSTTVLPEAMLAPEVEPRDGTARD